ncbi:protein-lysine N-methyltransferase EFM1 isoform X2 [Diospyros lotus]|uniref:protein-lysine N-methyltransferase EFM1 isoform X2 n=1 Tax=Diospyros lotus TaxID=55363 RepID=UPI002251BD6B|nr:protein-lysine N-methyltransferase EFM1 isoform X2 [Diospyros lotus]
MASPEESKLERFLQWLKFNGIELRGCNIKLCDSDKGFGLFASDDVSDGVLLVVPLDLAITPMRVLREPIIGPACRAMFEEGEVDDRFLMILFLTMEIVQKNSTWKPYLDMLPTTFGNPLWFSDDELLELKGTSLYHATDVQKKNLHAVFDDKVKNLVKKLLALNGDTESEVCFEDFLWANSIFWSRALSIPFPRSYVFPQVQDDQENTFSSFNKNHEACVNNISSEELVDGNGVEVCGMEGQIPGMTVTSIQGETVWVEGLVPGIDFCNHDLRAAATWEVDGTGLTTGVPCSMYLLSAGQDHLKIEKEISINYGNKGNEELLYLYGFVIDDNPDDYLMVNYPLEAIQSTPFAEAKLQLLEAQAELRCLLPQSLLDHGFFPLCTPEKDGNDKSTVGGAHNYSWCGQRKMPSYLNKLVFPEDFLTALRTIAMQEEEVYQATSLLKELVSGEERQPSDIEVQAAIWEACGDSGALQLLVDRLNMKMMDLEEGSGTEDHDTELLEGTRDRQTQGEYKSCQTNELSECETMSKNRRSSIVYRRGQKQLTRLFLREAEHALQLALSEGN